VRNRPAQRLANCSPVAQAIACSLILARELAFRNKIPTLGRFLVSRRFAEVCFIGTWATMQKPNHCSKKLWIFFRKPSPGRTPGDRPTKLAQAGAELGRIDKTIHALTYIDDETKRRRILVQLNRLLEICLKPVFCSVAPQRPNTGRKCSSQGINVIAGGSKCMEHLYKASLPEKSSKFDLYIQHIVPAPSRGHKIRDWV
jgi:hypothetical protein